MGFSLGSIMKSLVNPMSLMQLAMGPAGWASLAMKTIGTAIAQQVIQQLGQRFGIPQPLINMAQQAFASATGTQGLPNSVAGGVRQLAEQFNLSPRAQGDLLRAGNSFAENFDKMIMDRIKSSGGQEAEDLKSGGKKGGSILMRIAIAMGQLMDKKMFEMEGLTTEIGNVGKNPATGEFDKEAKNGQQQKLGELTGKLQGLGQEVSLLSNAMTNTIKSIGEANSTIARKG
jgi:hypothetical protein